MIECVYIEKNIFLEAIKIKEIADWMLSFGQCLYEKQDTLESLFDYYSDMDKIMISDDDDYSTETLIDLLDKHDIKHQVDYQ